MKEIKEILNVLHSEHLEKEAVLSEPTLKNKSLTIQLASGIFDLKYQTDQEAAADLYGKIYNKHDFQILKSRLKQKALNSLLLFEVKQTKSCPRDAMKHHLKRSLIMGEMLLLFGARRTGIKIIHKVSTLSSRFLLNDLNLQAIHLLRSHFWYVGNEKMFMKATIKLSLFLEVLSAEYRSEEIYQLSTIAFAKSRSNNTVPPLRLKYAMKEMEQLGNKYSKLSFVIRINDHKMRISYNQLRSDNKKVITECNKALLFYSRSKIFRSDALSVYFLLNKCEALFFSGEYEKMLSSVSDLKQLTEGKRANRISIERFGFIANMHIGKFEVAKKIVLDVLNDKELLPTAQNLRSEWILFNAYTEIVGQIKEITTSKIGEKPICFLVQLPSFTKDKQGMNISLLVCDVVRNIILRQYTKLMQLDKKMDNYLYRYLNKRDANHRAIVFLRMLRVVIKEDFDKEKIIQRTGPLLQELQRDQSKNFIEIVPFEKLWEMVLKTL